MFAKLNAVALFSAPFLPEPCEINDDDLARLSSLQHEHINMLGTFHSALPDELTAGQRHTLRTATTDGLSVRYYRKAVLASSASSAASAMCWLSRLADKLRARANVAHVRTAA